MFIQAIWRWCHKCGHVWHASEIGMGKPTARGNTLTYQGLCYQAYFSRLLLLLQEPRQEHHPQQQLLDLRRREMLMSLSACLTKSWLQQLLFQTQSLLLLFILLELIKFWRQFQHLQPTRLLFHKSLKLEMYHNSEWQLENPPLNGKSCSLVILNPHKVGSKSTSEAPFQYSLLKDWSSSSSFSVIIPLSPSYRASVRSTQATAPFFSSELTLHHLFYIFIFSFCFPF